MQSLDKAITSIPIHGNLPIPLPSGHISKLRHFDSILSQGKLIPQLSPYLSENLIFLSYGGLFYRPSDKPTRDETEMPIAFIFSPKILKCVLRYFPFDTGAVFSGRFGVWGERFKDSWLQFQVLSHGDINIPCRIVAHIYQTNRRYIVGAVQVNCRNLPDPFPDIYDFLSTDLTFLGVDHRQLTIECHVDKPIQLSKYLMWIGLPEWRDDILIKIYELTKPDLPRYYPYSSHAVFKPSEIVSQLHIKALEEIERFLNFAGDR